MYSRIKTLVLRGVVLACVGFVSPFTTAQAALVISTGTTAHVTCAHHVCTATSSDAVFNVTKLQNRLTKFKLKMVSGSAAGDIVIDAPLTWVNANTLTLDAYHSIVINKPVSDTGSGGLTLTTNDGGTGGTLSFGAKGDVTFWSLSDVLKINGANYTLVNNIAALASGIAANPWGRFALANSYNAKPDGIYAAVPIPTPFKGIFEGLGNHISNLTIKDATDSFSVGLFNEIDTKGMVRDVGVVNANVQRNGTHQATVGILAGSNSGTIFRAAVTGSVVANLVSSAAGGLVGFNGAGTIIGSNSSATVSAVGANAEGGGLVGLDGNGAIDSSFATGAVKGGRRSIVGGLVASIAESPTVVTNCYATGSVSGGDNSNVGGLMGMRQFGVDIISSYSTGVVTAGSGKDTALGGFIGWNTAGTSTQSYWDMTTSGTDIGVGKGTDTGATGLTTTQLQSGLPAGFDPTIWAENPAINGGLPYLIANPPS